MSHATEPTAEKILAIISLSEDELSQIKNWTVGRKYTVTLKLEQVGSYKRPWGESKGKIMGDFRVISAKAEADKVEKRY